MRNREPGMTLIVKTITRLTVGLILIYGIYIVLQGHVGPGGGFAGGVIIALSFIHLMLAFGKDAVLKKLNEAKGVLLMGAGAITFLLIFSLGFMQRQHPIAPKGYFSLFGTGLISLCDIAISVMVGAGLFVVFLALVLLTGAQEKK